MNVSKCPVCHETVEESNGEFFCGAEDCSTSFITCPFCGECLGYFSCGSKARYQYEVGSCPHVVAVIESGPDEVCWDNSKEEARYLAWRKKHEPKEEDEYEELEDFDDEDFDDEDFDDEEDRDTDAVTGENMGCDADKLANEDTGRNRNEGIAEDTTQEKEPDMCDWDTDSLSETEVFEKYVEEQSDWFCKYLYEGNGRHGSSTTFYLKENTEFEE